VENDARRLCGWFHLRNTEVWDVEPRNLDIII
jgi:hypothetical protein